MRAAAITALTKFAVQLPALKKSVSVLLRRSLQDEDDEVRDRATLALRLLGDDINSILNSCSDLATGDAPSDEERPPIDISASDEEVNLLLEPLPMQFSKLAQALNQFEMTQIQMESVALTIETLPFVEDKRPGASIQVAPKF